MDPNNTITVDDKTWVAVGVVINARDGPNGDPIRAYQYRRGSPEDLKPGRQATVNATEDNARAITVEVLLDSDDAGPGL